ncbi:nucleotidyltransferase family protein [Tessaracoccus sp. MC1679]|uniref:nucleotidyltransferase family protein n=1 Tax=Tessaracoccus sp. MC1679 TaxID=2760313 RepID=UPI0015FFCA89|nr:nucleotidyltransferase family protein [Tessaracoccus sp. MC1679]MBB1514865.1 nucleotidyltransferase family protein [Tessaracoccus sp. MC1679]
MNETMPTKAVILARGLGTRMRRAADVDLDEDQRRAAELGLKAMMPVGLGDTSGGGQPAHPFLDHVISELADAGLTDICLVIGPEHDLVRDYYATLDLSRVRISFAVQVEALGTADAVRAARGFAGGDRFVMVNADNFYPADAVRALRRAPGTATVGFDAAAMVSRSNIPADRIAAFAILDTDAEGYLVDLIEKPPADVVARFGPHARISMNCFLFGASIFNACDAIRPSARGEYEIVDAVRWLIAAGEPVTVVPVAEGVLDMSGRTDVPLVAAALASRPVRL